MKTLAIDTSTKTQTLALTDGANVVARRLSVVRTNHSPTLLANIDDMLTQAQWKPADLSLVAVGLGPGTFTGLRVGLATAKAAARGASAAIVGVGSLAATSRPISTLFDGTIYALCDARRGEVYVASFKAAAGRVDQLSEPEAITPALLRERVLATTGPVTLVGNGLRAHPDLQTWSRDDVQAMPQPWDAPSSVSIALLGQARFSADGPDDLAALEPNYVRLSDAEIALAERSS